MKSLISMTVLEAKCSLLRISALSPHRTACSNQLCRQILARDAVALVLYDTLACGGWKRGPLSPGSPRGTLVEGTRGATLSVIDEARHILNLERLAAFGDASCPGWQSLDRRGAREHVQSSKCSARELSSTSSRLFRQVGVCWVTKLRT
jgi:hypothetical protein